MLRLTEIVFRNDKRSISANVRVLPKVALLQLKLINKTKICIMKKSNDENFNATFGNTVLPAVFSRTIFRIEKPEDRNGMWYNKNGIFMETIDILCPNGIAKDFPMPLNLELYRKDGEIWNSAGKSIENMNEWFTPMDAINLMNNGYKLFEFEVNMFQELENEILFCRKGIIQQKEIPLENVWDIRSVLNGR